MPLSGIGLCEAEIITPRSAPSSPVRNATPGVGSTPTRSDVAPALVRPAATAASSISPLARGSRPTTASGAGSRASRRRRHADTAGPGEPLGAGTPRGRTRTTAVASAVRATA